MTEGQHEEAGEQQPERMTVTPCRDDRGECEARALHGPSAICRPGASQGLRNLARMDIGMLHRVQLPAISCVAHRFNLGG